MIEIPQGTPIRKQLGMLSGKDSQWPNKVANFGPLSIVGFSFDATLQFKDCINYAAGEVGILERPSDYKQIQQDTYQFLLSKGFGVVDVPQRGDLVGYAARTLKEGAINMKPRAFKELFGFPLKERRPAYFVHWGILDEESAEGVLYVRSKFGLTGHVYKHPIDAVPPHYGSIVQFFRYQGIEEAREQLERSRPNTLNDFYKEVKKRGSITVVRNGKSPQERR